jgi:hypothetical protein
MPSGSIEHLTGTVYITLLVLGLIVADIGTSVLLWICISATHFAWLARAYFTADNHLYLIGYWCIAVCIALFYGGERGDMVLRETSRLLVGLCFLLAVITKMWSDNFRSGSLFIHTMLSDPRFVVLARCIAGISREQQQKYHRAIIRLESGASEREPVRILGRTRVVAKALVWWTIGIEMVVSTAFLLPQGESSMLRTGSIIVFVLTTFGVVQVTAFAQILLLIAAVGVVSVSQGALLVSLAIVMPILTFVPAYSQSLVRILYAEGQRVSG